MVIVVVVVNVIFFTVNFFSWSRPSNAVVRGLLGGWWSHDLLIIHSFLLFPPLYRLDCDLLIRRQMVSVEEAAGGGSDASDSWLLT